MFVVVVVVHHFGRNCTGEHFIVTRFGGFGRDFEAHAAKPATKWERGTLFLQPGNVKSCGRNLFVEAHVRFY